MNIIEVILNPASTAGREDANAACGPAAFARDQTSFQGRRPSRYALWCPLPQIGPTPRDPLADECQRQGGGRHWEIAWYAYLITHAQQQLTFFVKPDLSYSC